MSVSRRLAALALAALLMPLAAFADDDNAAFSSAPTLMKLCGVGPDADRCKGGDLYAKQAAELDAALQMALAKAPANIRPMLKRDQSWFGETLANVAGDAPKEQIQAARDAYDGALRARIAALGEIAEGFGRSGASGRWVNAFGSVVAAAADGGAISLAIETDSGYSPYDDQRWHCRATALVKPTANGWLAGELIVEKKPEQEGTAKPADGDTAPPRKLPVKMRRQGESLRIIVKWLDWDFDYDTLSCRNSEQITATYFASGKPDASASDKTDTGFVAPTFDCAHPSTASDEEICADPDLAAQDIKLNRAWKALLPRLDDATRRGLTEDQRRWVREQAGVYPNELHPGGDKTTYDLHHTGSARDMLDKLQRERIALFEGFDETRKGLAGLWLSHNAVLTVTAPDEGGIQAKGQKWEWDDRKAGCDYDMQGKATGNSFRAADQTKNPDTLERDHAMLIVNRQDDAFARKRQGDKGADEMKCRRSMQASSTVRLFPVRSSPDIDPSGDWHH
jgi:hypothetical protein